MFAFCKLEGWLSYPWGHLTPLSPTAIHKQASPPVWSGHDPILPTYINELQLQFEGAMIPLSPTYISELHLQFEAAMIDVSMTSSSYYARDFPRPHAAHFRAPTQRGATRAL